MQKQFLLPHKWKTPGWIILFISLAAGIILQIIDFNSVTIPAKMFVFVNEELMNDNQYFTFANVNLIYTLPGIFIIAGSLMVAFSKEKSEDEFIASLRLSSFQWAVLVDYLILLVCFLFIYGLPFFTVMTYNMFTVIFLFIIRFNFLLGRYKQISTDEE